MEPYMTTFRKTQAGEHEISTRKIDLGMLDRSILLMIDGKRPFAEIHKRMSALGNVDTAIAKITQLGLVELVADTSAATVSAASAASTKQANPQFYGVKSAAILLIRRALESALGPGADASMIKLESAKNTEQFDLAVEHALTLLAQAKGAAQRTALEEKLALLVATA
jgi:hypothetical protein